MLAGMYGTPSQACNFKKNTLIVRPNGADHQRGKDPPRQMLVRSGS